MTRILFVQNISSITFSNVGKMFSCFLNIRGLVTRKYPSIIYFCHSVFIKKIVFVLISSELIDLHRPRYSCRWTERRGLRHLYRLRRFECLIFSLCRGVVWLIPHTLPQTGACLSASSWRNHAHGGINGRNHKYPQHYSHSQIEKTCMLEFTKSDLILLTSMTFHLRSVVASRYMLWLHFR